MINITDIEAINIRCSRRYYTDTPIDDIKIKSLKILIDKYNMKEGLNIKFIHDGADAFRGFNSYGMFKGVRSLIVLSGNKSINNLREKLGFYGELLVIEATKLNLGTCWVAGTFNKKYFKDLGNDELVCVITIGNVPQDKVLKEKIFLRLVHKRSKDLKEFYIKDKEAPNWFIEGVKAVQKAPSAANKQPVKLKYEKGEVYAFIEGDNDIQLVDLGIAMANFSLIAGGYFEFKNMGKFFKI